MRFSPTPTPSSRIPVLCLLNMTKKCDRCHALCIRSYSRDISRRKDAALRGFVERAVDFGLERDTLARFLPAANATELAAKQMLDDATRPNARRLVSCFKDALVFSRKINFPHILCTFFGCGDPSGICRYRGGNGHSCRNFGR